ncbi:MAG: hypothetical protein LBD12_06015, partial [Clostridiales Family XIII bacterium]|nr:hypothetical protein [Clostridiales Family XIII bacterium]
MLGPAAIFAAEDEAADPLVLEQGIVVTEAPEAALDGEAAEVAEDAIGTDADADAPSPATSPSIEPGVVSICAQPGYIYMEAEDIYPAETPRVRVVSQSHLGASQFLYSMDAYGQYTDWGRLAHVPGAVYWVKGFLSAGKDASGVLYDAAESDPVPFRILETIVDARTLTVLPDEEGEGYGKKFLGVANHGPALEGVKAKLRFIHAGEAVVDPSTVFDIRVMAAGHDLGYFSYHAWKLRAEGGFEFLPGEDVFYVDAKAGAPVGAYDYEVEYSLT